MEWALSYLQLPSPVIVYNSHWVSGLGQEFVGHARMSKVMAHSCKVHACNKQLLRMHSPTC